MEKDIIGSVIEVETEIRKRLAAEEKKAQEWLDQVRNDSEERIIHEEASLQDHYDRSLLNEKELASVKVSEMLRDVQEKALHLDSLPYTVLNEIITRHIIMILPGEGYDSADVKGSDRGAQRTS